MAETTVPGWHAELERDRRGFYQLRTKQTGGVPVRLFVTEALLADIDPAVYDQFLNATHFPGG